MNESLERIPFSSLEHRDCLELFEARAVDGSMDSLRVGWFSRFIDVLFLALSMAALSVLPARAAFDVIAWGSDASGQLKIPTAATNIVACAAGENHSVVLRFDGAVFNWGSNEDGQCDYPGSPRPIVAIAAGNAHSLALRDDGQLIAWGRAPLTSIPPTATNIIAIAAGTSHSVALSSGGQITIWGTRGNGVAFTENLLSRDANSVSASMNGTFVRTADDWSFSGSQSPWHFPRRITDGSFPLTAASVGLTERIIRSKAQIVPVAYALTSNGELYSTFQTKTPLASDVRWFAGFETNGLVLFNDGRNLGWGSWKTATLPQALAKAVAASIGRNHGVALVPNRQEPVLLLSPGRSIVSEGDPYTPFVRVVSDSPFSIQWLAEGLPIVNSTDRSPVLRPSMDVSRAQVRVIVSNAAGSVTSAPVTLQGTPVKQWGNLKLKGAPVPVEGAQPVRIVAGPYHAATVNEDGSLSCWGKNNDLQCGVPSSATNVMQAALGLKHSIALRRDGVIVAWGSNAEGQCEVPIQATDGIAVAAGYSHSVALRKDKQVVVWGSNEFGQLNAPLGLDNVIGICAGAFHTLALREDRTLVSWGLETEVPEFATNVIRVAAGFRHSLALRADGTVVAWGDNSAGQCDVPNFSVRVIDVAAGYQHSMALLETGRIAVWGRDFLPNPGLMLSGEVFDGIAAAEEISLAVRLHRLPKSIRISGRDRAPVGSAVLLSPEYPLPFRAKVQWFHNEVPMDGATNAALSLESLSLQHAGKYSVSVFDDLETIQSESFSLIVTERASIETPLQHTNHPPNLPLSLRVQLAGSSPLEIQWMRNGIPLVEGEFAAGVSTGELRFSKPSLSMSGRYSVALRNSEGSVTNDVWDLTVTPLVVWGETSLRQDRVPAHSTAPVQVTAGANHTLALLANQTVIAWGDDSQGQLQVPAVASFRTIGIASGENHNLALLDSGDVLAWGDNRQRQCDVPSGISNIAFVTASGNRSGVVSRDGEVTVWGGNQDIIRVPPVAGGILGVACNQRSVYGITADNAAVVALTYPGSFMPISTGRMLVLTGHQSLGISLVKGLRKVVVWGYAANGEWNVPDDLGSPVAVAAGGFTSMALNSERRVYAWGQIDRGWPAVPSLATNVVQIARGIDHAVALRYFEEPRLEIAASPLTPQAGAPAEIAPSSNIQNWDAFQWTRNGAVFNPPSRPAMKFTPARWEDRGTYQLTISRGPLSIASPTLRFDPEEWVLTADNSPIVSRTIELIGPHKIAIRNPFGAGFAFLTFDGSDPSKYGQLITEPFGNTTNAQWRCVVYNHDFSDVHVAAAIEVLSAPYATISATTPGGGIVTTVPAGPYFKLGSRIQIAAKPEKGWQFLEWRNQSRGLGASLETDVTSDEHYEAVFGTDLGLQTIGNGSILRSPDLSLYPFGSAVQLTAMPNSAAGFLGWGFPDPTHSPRTNIVVTKDSVSMRAIFGGLGHAASLLNASTQGPGRLEVIPDKAEYLPGEPVIVTALPESGAEFVAWEGAVSTSNPIVTLTMEESRRILAHFESRRVVSIRPISGPNAMLVETRIEGAPGEVYRIDQSFDLHDWGNVRLHTNWTGAVVVSDRRDQRPYQFFRVQ